MRRIPLSVKNQSIETSGITKDYREAICEYIWNGFEANAKNVELEWKHNQLDGGDIISIADNGDGINFNNLDNTFGTFLASQKNSLSLKAKSKANKGKGRFSFMCCASDVLWKTVYSDTETQTNYEYELSLSDSSKEFIDCNEPQPTIKGTGTIATLLNVFGFDLNDLQSEEFTNYLLTEFAWYLYLNKNTSLHVNGQVLDYSSYINTNLSEEINVNIFGHDFKINLIVWNAKIKEKFCCYYLDDNNSIKGKNTTTYNRNTIDFNHSVFIKSNFFNKLDVEKIDSPQMTFGGPDDGQGIIKELNKIVLDLISRKIDMTMKQLRDELNMKGVKNSKGGKISIDVISRMLTNRKYLGEYTFQDITIKDGIPAIISTSLFEKVQDRLAKTKKAPSSHKADDDYILTTKLFCGKCKSFMVGESGTNAQGKKYRYYKCVNHKKHQGCDMKSIRKDLIENMTIKYIREFLNDEDLINTLIDLAYDAQHKENEQLPLLRKQLAQTEKGIKNIVDAIEQGISTKSTRERLLDLEQRRNDIEMSISKESIENPMLTKKQFKFWFNQLKKLDISKSEQRQKLVDLFVNSIIIYDDKIKFFFNYKKSTKTITFDELNNCSDLPDSPRPYRVFIKNFVNTLFYLYQLIQTQKHLLLKIKSQHIDIF